MCELIDFLLSKKERQIFSPKTSGRSIYCHQFSLIQKSFRFANLPKNFPTFFFPEVSKQHVVLWFLNIFFSW